MSKPTQPTPSQSSSLFGSLGQYNEGLSGRISMTMMQIGQMFTQLAVQYGNMFSTQMEFQKDAANDAYEENVSMGKDQMWSQISEGIGQLINAAGQIVSSCGGPEDGEDPDFTTQNKYLSELQDNYSKMNLSDAPERGTDIIEASQKYVNQFDPNKLTLDAEGNIPEDEADHINTLTPDENLQLQKDIKENMQNQRTERMNQIRSNQEERQTRSLLIQGTAGALAAPTKVGSGIATYHASEHQGTLAEVQAALSQSQNGGEHNYSQSTQLQQQALQEIQNINNVNSAETR